MTDEPRPTAAPSSRAGGRETTDADREIGRRVRQRRMLLGMSQEQLGAAIGVTFQQIQKYERGLNRISAGRVPELSRALDVPVTYFFEGLAPDRPGGADDEFARSESLRLVRAYWGIRDDRVREATLDLVKSLARADR